MSCSQLLRRLTQPIEKHGLAWRTLRLADASLEQDADTFSTLWSSNWLVVCSALAAFLCCSFIGYDKVVFPESFLACAVLRLVMSAAIAVVTYLLWRYRREPAVIRRIIWPGCLLSKPYALMQVSFATRKATSTVGSGFAFAVFWSSQAPRLVPVVAGTARYRTSTYAPLILFGMASIVPLPFPQMVVLLHALSLGNTVIELSLVGPQKLVVLSALVLQLVTLEQCFTAYLACFGRRRLFLAQHKATQGKQQLSPQPPMAGVALTKIAISLGGTVPARAQHASLLNGLEDQLDSPTPPNAWDASADSERAGRPLAAKTGWGAPASATAAAAAAAPAAGPPLPLELPPGSTTGAGAAPPSFATWYRNETQQSVRFASLALLLGTVLYGLQDWYHPFVLGLSFELLCVRCCGGLC
jgi:hypothetical protein